MANVQELITKMMFSMQNQRTPNGHPMVTMRDLYCCFERDYDAIARQTGTNTGIVFADCLDAVGKLQKALRETAENALRMKEAEEQAAAAAAEKAAEEAARVAPEPTRRRGGRTTAVNGGKKPGVGRTVVSSTPTKVSRRGRPKGSKNKVRTRA